MNNRWCLLFAILIAMSGCSFFEKERAPGDIPITFTDLTHGEDCAYEVEIDKSLWKVNYLAFYLSRPELKVKGRWVPVDFKVNDWQSQDVSFIQFQNACDESKNRSHLMLNVNQALLDRATELRFTMGLNFDDNHSSQVEQIAPLDKPAMYQSVNAGHNFFRLELQNTRAPSSIWSFLLASGGCNNGEASARPTECIHPNRVTVILPMAQNVSDLSLLARLQQILFRVDLQAVPECNMARAPHGSCEKVMKNLTSRGWLKWDAPDKVYLKS